MIDSQASRRQAPHPPPPQRRRRSRGRGAPPPEPSESNQSTAVAEPEAIRIPSGATVRDVAEHLGVQVSDVIKKLMQLGEMASITQTLSDEAIGVIADEFEKKIEVVTASEDETPAPVFDDADEDLSARPPVVTIMGHVDHGKTSLLDAIRETEVAAGEAGGITQHIGAYQVHHGDKVVTFLDTPGHEAFTAMRARGAKVTDIAVIVVAADDGVMPQTTEAIDHAKAAGVPMVIAVNKIDKEGAQPERVRGELGGQGLTPEEWGGDTIFCDVSAKTKEGLDNLLDMILLVAEVEELKANADAPASGHVIESKLDPGRGPVVTILVQRGTLKTGDALVAGAHWGRVRAMHDFLGNRAKRAMPGEPVEVLGFDSVPDAGEPVRVVGNDREARQLAGERAIRLKTEQLARRKSAPVSLEDVFDRVKEGEAVALNIVLKADVAGSLEALQDQLAKVSTSQVGLNVLHTGVGGITQSDVMLAAASGAVIIGFNVRPLPEAKTLADHEGVEIRSYTVIYKITEELRAAMEGMLEPEEVEQSLGMAEVRQTVPRIAHRHDRRLARRPGQDHAQRARAAGARGNDHLRRHDHFAEALQGRRPGSRGRLRVRNRARELQRPQGGRRHRGVRDPEGRPDARVASATHGRAVPGRPHDPPPPARQRQPEGKAQGVAVGALRAESPVRRLRGRGGRAGPVAARDAGRRPRGAIGRGSGARRGRDRAVPARAIPGRRADRAPARVVRGPR